MKLSRREVIERRLSALYESRTREMYYAEQGDSVAVRSLIRIETRIDVLEHELEVCDVC